MNINGQGVRRRVASGAAPNATLRVRAEGDSCLAIWLKLSSASSVSGSPGNVFLLDGAVEIITEDKTGGALSQNICCESECAHADGRHVHSCAPSEHRASRSREVDASKRGRRGGEACGAVKDRRFKRNALFKDENGRSSRGCPSPPRGANPSCYRARRLRGWFCEWSNKSKN